MSPIRKKFYSLLPGVIRKVIRLIGLTCKVRHHGLNKEQISAHLGSGIMAAWHGNIVHVSFCLRNQGLHVMVSRSRDGELISRFSSGFGFHFVRGSSSKGAASATRGILRLLKVGTPIAITPDGPRGPKHTLQPGILWLSAMSRKPILPVHIEANRQWTAKGWDELKIPKPFSTIHVHWGEPIIVDKNDLKNREQDLISEVQDALRNNAKQATIYAQTS